MQKRHAKEWSKVSSQQEFSLWQRNGEMTTFQVRLTGSNLRRKFVAQSIPEALEQAPYVAGLKSDRQQGAHTLEEAFNECLKASKREKQSTKDWKNAVIAFMTWLLKKYPGCATWDRMTRQILREYLNTFEGKSANYRRLRVQPILQTSLFMHREHGFVNFGDRMGIGNKLAKTPPFVTVEDALAFCDWVSCHKDQRHLEIGLVLQAFTSLQLLEALRLTWDKVDLERGIIEISGTVKNEYRNRTIPVCKRVVEALQRARARQLALKKPLGHVVVGKAGKPFEDFCTYSRQVGLLITEWNPRCDWCPKDLRNCLSTFAVFEGRHSSAWEQYMGHAPKTVTERHYLPRLASATKGEGTRLKLQMDLFRREIVQYLDESIDGFRKILQSEDLALEST